MKKLNAYDKMNAASLAIPSPEWRRVQKARKATTQFDVPLVDMPIETRTLNGHQVRLAEAGPDDAPLVVLLSPFPESILSFMASWEALTSAFHVIAIDMPGFGASEGDRNDMSPNALGDHLAAIFDELDLTDIHLVGPDVGMGAALAYATNHGEARLASLTVGHGPGAPGPFKLAILLDMMTKSKALRTMSGLLGAGPLLALSYMLGAVRHRPNPTQIDDFKTSYTGRAAEAVFWFEDFREKATALSKRIPDIAVPTLVFWGEHDVMFDVSNAEHLHEALPNSKLQIIPHAGHFSWSDQPEIFAEMITDWVTTS